MDELCAVESGTLASFGPGPPLVDEVDEVDPPLELDVDPPLELDVAPPLLLVDVDEEVPGSTAVPLDGPGSVAFCVVSGLEKSSVEVAPLHAAIAVATARDPIRHPRWFMPFQL